MFIAQDASVSLLGVMIKITLLNTNVLIRIVEKMNLKPNGINVTYYFLSIFHSDNSLSPCFSISLFPLEKNIK